VGDALDVDSVGHGCGVFGGNWIGECLDRSQLLEEVVRWESMSFAEKSLYMWE
jgi:hypothetical protein